MRRLFRNALLLDPEAAEPAPGHLIIEDGRIAGRLAPGDPEPEAADVLDLAGRGLAPGFLDLHFHGGLVFAQPGAIRETLRHSALSLARHGTTSFLATTVAWPRDELLACVEILASCCSEFHDAPDDASIPIGIHLEGPWIRPEAAGAQPRGGIRPYEPDEGAEVFARADGAIRMVTLAPEIHGASRLQSDLERRGILAALGHSLADDACIQGGVERGMRHVTHLFNAMGPLHHRTLGAAGVALTDDRLSCDLICDGVHVHPDVVRLAARAKGDRLLLITDRLDISVADSPQGFGSGTLHDDGTALRLPDGTLAGSRLHLDQALRNAQAFGAMTRLEAMAACTLRPARLLGIEADRGTLRPGARADLVVLDDGDEVRQTWIGGRRVYDSGTL